MSKFLKIIRILIYINFFTVYIYGQNKDIRANKSSILYKIENNEESWFIDTKINPDKLIIYIPKDSVFVSFNSEIDSNAFYLKPKDTIRFSILLNNESAYTEVVGYNEIQNTISNIDKIFYLSKLWSEAKYNFVNMDQLEINWDSTYYKYIEEVVQTKNDYEYYLVLKSFYALLKDGHTQVSDYGQFYMFKDYIPALFLNFNNKIYLTSLRKNVLNNVCFSDSILIGGELIELNNLPINKYLKDSIFPYISSSTQEHLFMQGVTAMHYNLKSKTFKAKLLIKNDTIDINLPYNGEETRTINDEYWGVKKRYPSSDFSIEFNDSISVLTLNSCMDNVIDSIKKYIIEINKTDGLIIDLRNNRGGSTDVAWYIQSLFTEENFFLNYAWETRINDGVGKANGNWIKEYEDFYKNIAIEHHSPDTIVVLDSIRKIKVKTIFLIGRYTFSAAEDLLVNMKEIKTRPIYIGESTAGSTGSPLVISGLPGGGYARVCTRRICYPYSNDRFVKSGVMPDIKVSPTINDFLNNKDIVLEKAKEILIEK